VVGLCQTTSRGAAVFPPVPAPRLNTSSLAALSLPGVFFKTRAQTSCPAHTTVRQLCIQAGKATSALLANQGSFTRIPSGAGHPISSYHPLSSGAGTSCPSVEAQEQSLPFSGCNLYSLPQPCSPLLPHSLAMHPIACCAFPHGHSGRGRTDI